MSPTADIDVLSSKERTALRARAHSLKPVVWVADSGITPGAMHEIDRALDAHELIKVHAAVAGREARTALLADICVALRARPVQVIGKMLIVFRPRPQHESPPEQPKPRAKPAKRNLGTSKKARSKKRMPIRANRSR